KKGEHASGLLNWIALLPPLSRPSFSVVVSSRSHDESPLPLPYAASATAMVDGKVGTGQRMVDYCLYFYYSILFAVVGLFLMVWRGWWYRAMRPKNKKTKS
ncbi:hypothetical protein Pfo_016281, partial [Paulownia fortunei]